MPHLSRFPAPSQVMLCGYSLSLHLLTDQSVAGMLQVPSEIQLLGIYLPPLLLVCLLGLACTLAVTQLLNWTGASRFCWHPPLAFVALWILCASLIGLLFIAP